MAATREDVNRWIDYAKKEGYPFIISVCDTYDYDDYPIYCKNSEEVFKQWNNHNGQNMQKVNEIIRIDEEGSVVTENLNINNFLVQLDSEFCVAIFNCILGNMVTNSDWLVFFIFNCYLCI